LERRPVRLQSQHETADKKCETDRDGATGGDRLRFRRLQWPTEGKQNHRGDSAGSEGCFKEYFDVGHMYGCGDKARCGRSPDRATKR
ncbi:MAG TPA: hypothetical protein VKB78_05920, partial [Pirellulales bacterium]|nr:hypothetical protein [Pirellulales bacterium]